MKKHSKIILSFCLIAIGSTLFTKAIMLDDFYDFVELQFIGFIDSFIPEEQDRSLQDDHASEENLGYIHRGPNGYVKGFEI